MNKKIEGNRKVFLKALLWTLISISLVLIGFIGSAYLTGGI